MKFKVGQRVRCMNANYPSVYHQRGTVISCTIMLRCYISVQVQWDKEELNVYPWINWFMRNDGSGCDLDSIDPLTPEELDQRARREHADKYL